MTARQRVLVTAGAAGIGRGVVEAFLDAGADVGVCDISEEALETVARDLSQVSRTRLDVADGAAVKSWILKSAEAMGGLDVLVNNAGIGGPACALEDTDEAQWNQCLAVNLSGAFFATQAATIAMKAQRTGAIINISTTSVRTGLPRRTAYVASKQGLMGLTRNAARELGPFNIRCNAILPGMIDNDRGRMLLRRFANSRGVSAQAAEAELLSHVSMRTWIQPREIGDVAVFLASHAARHVTGQFLGVCGGVEWEG